MSKTFEQGRSEVSKLCQYFATNRDRFLAPGVKEAHIRQNLIDPMFDRMGSRVERVAFAWERGKVVGP